LNSCFTRADGLASFKGKNLSDLSLKLFELNANQVKTKDILTKSFEPSMLCSYQHPNGGLQIVQQRSRGQPNERPSPFWFGRARCNIG
jgi:hypothetical protein